MEDVGKGTVLKLDEEVQEETAERLKEQREEAPEEIESEAEAEAMAAPVPTDTVVSVANTNRSQPAVERHKQQDAWMTPEQKANRDAAHQNVRVQPAVVKHSDLNDAVAAIESATGVDHTTPGGHKVKIIPYTGSLNVNGGALLNGGGRAVIVVEIDGVPVTFYQSGGTAQTDIPDSTVFSGYLAC